MLPARPVRLDLLRDVVLLHPRLHPNEQTSADHQLRQIDLPAEPDAGGTARRVLPPIRGVLHAGDHPESAGVD